MDPVVIVHEQWERPEGSSRRFHTDRFISAFHAFAGTTVAQQYCAEQIIKVVQSPPRALVFDASDQAEWNVVKNMIVDQFEHHEYQNVIDNWKKFWTGDFGQPRLYWCEITAPLPVKG